MDYIVVLITASGAEEAEKIARTLVGENLAACVNMQGGVRSIYRWKGEVCDEPEVMMLAKTTSDNFAAIEKRVRELHSYEVPEVIAIPVVMGSKPYLDWIEENTRLA